MAFMIFFRFQTQFLVILGQKKIHIGISKITVFQKLQIVLGQNSSKIAIFLGHNISNILKIPIFLCQNVSKISIFLGQDILKVSIFLGQNISKIPIFICPNILNFRIFSNIPKNDFIRSKCSKNIDFLRNISKIPIFIGQNTLRKSDFRRKHFLFHSKVARFARIITKMRHFSSFSSTMMLILQLKNLMVTYAMFCIKIESPYSLLKQVCYCCSVVLDKCTRNIVRIPAKKTTSTIKSGVF